MQDALKRPPPARALRTNLDPDSLGMYGEYPLWNNRKNPSMVGTCKWIGNNKKFISNCSVENLFHEILLPLFEPTLPPFEGAWRM